MAKKSKAHRQRQHARNRAKERYGIYLHQDLNRKWVNLIQNNQARFVCRQSNRVTIFDLEHEGTLVRVVYDKLRKTIVTVLYPIKEIKKNTDGPTKKKQ